MKQFAFFLFTLWWCTTMAYAQVPVNEKTKAFQYQEVVHEEGTQADFFIRAINWVNNTYKNSAEVTQVRDPHTGIIEGNHRFRLQNSNAEGIITEGEMILYTFSLQFKEGRYRYTFGDFVVKKTSRFPLERWADPEDPEYRIDLSDVLTQVNEHISGLIKALKEEMKPPVEVIEEDW
ncbi:MAG: DUF4468 domain-containing protein [Bacteroidia bacterium]|nr:DUF4468 domain-containing protein [Bacteroidia bacterium]